MLYITTSRVIKLTTQFEHAARLVIDRPIYFSTPTLKDPHKAERMSFDIIRIALEWFQLQRNDFNLESICVGVCNEKGFPHDKLFQRNAELFDLHDLEAYSPEQFPLHFTNDDHFVVFALMPDLDKK